MRLYEGRYMRMEWECVHPPAYLVGEEMVCECLKCGGNIQSCMSANASILCVREA